MKILGIEIRKFKEKAETINVVETWNVRWFAVVENSLSSSRQRFSVREKEMVQGFPSKESAEAYAKELKDARRLLGDSYSDPVIERFTLPTNV